MVLIRASCIGYWASYKFDNFSSQDITSIASTSQLSFMILYPTLADRLPTVPLHTDSKKPDQQPADAPHLWYIFLLMVDLYFELVEFLDWKDSATDR